MSVVLSSCLTLSISCCEKYFPSNRCISSLLCIFDRPTSVRALDASREAWCLERFHADLCVKASLLYRFCLKSGNYENDHYNSGSHACVLVLHRLARLHLL